MATKDDSGAWVVWCQTCQQAITHGTGPIPTPAALAEGIDQTVARHLREGGQCHQLTVRGRVTEDRRQSER